VNNSTKLKVQNVRGVRPDTWRKLRVYAAMIDKTFAEAIDDALDIAITQTGDVFKDVFEKDMSSPRKNQNMTD
jgi:hypothetical protein